MKSPFTHRFSTNYTPTRDELDQIRQLIVQPSTQLEDLDAQISILLAQRYELNDFIVHHKNLLSPIRQIPPDVLQEIFVQCLPTKHNSIMSCWEAPLLLGRVCNYWRSLSRATPKLWSSFHISIPELHHGPNLEDSLVFAQAVTDWLNRSGSLPLSISVHESPVWQPANDDHGIISRIIPFLGRWKHVEFSINSPLSPESFAISPEQVPLLESLSLELYKDSLIHPDGPVLPSTCEILQAPRLQGLLIGSSLLSADISMGWSHLTELIIAGRRRRLQQDTALTALDQCKNLVSCILEFEIPSTPRLESGARKFKVIVPLLKALAVRGGSDLGPFFDSLTLPALLHFAFHIDFSSGLGRAFDSPQLYAFLGRLTTLGSLSLTAYSLPRESLLSCLTEVPNISKLRLEFIGKRVRMAPGPPKITHPLDNHVLSLLTPTSKNRALCRTLKIIECDSSSVSDNALLDFIRSRTTLSSVHDVSRLIRVDFVLPRERGNNVFFVPPEVLQEGSEVTIAYHIPYSPPPRSLYPRRGIPEDHYPPRLTIPFGPCTP